jgi:hypothetical protein
MCADIVNKDQCENLINTPLYDKCLWFNGKCYLKNSCSNREIISSPTYPDTACGANCVKLEGSESCNTSCTNLFHYYNNSEGVCELITDCNERGIVNGEGRPCGTGCVKRVIAEGLSNEMCSNECSNKAHFKPNDQGICTLINDCKSRNVNTSSIYVCGSSTCYQQEGTTICDNNCINNYHYEANNKGICIEIKTCTERKVLKVLNGDENKRVCGSGNCYANENNKENGNLCVESCENPRFMNIIFIYFLFYITDIIFQITLEFVN